MRRKTQVAEEGLEHIVESSGKSGSSDKSSAKSDAIAADPDLALVVERWPKLSQRRKAAILGVVRKAGDEPVAR